MSETFNMDEILEQLSGNKKGMDSILETLNVFVETYAFIKDALNKFNIPQDYSFIKDLQLINQNLNETSACLQENKTFSEEMHTKLHNLQLQVSSFDSKIVQLNRVMSGLQEINKKIEMLNLSKQEEEIKNYGKQLEYLKDSINNDLVPLMNKNNETIKGIENKVTELMEKRTREEESIETIAKEFISVNQILKKISQNGNVNKAILFDLFEEWQDTRKKIKRK